jgi:formylglycine-generating enzyme required for sulfatase activity/serine/threonine protein kinase
MTSEHIGRVIRGRYRLISRIAEGGMGVTYRAWDLRVGEPVVLKMPKRPRGDPDGNELSQVATRFLREIEAMRALSHDHIVPIVDSGDDEGLPFVAMRFLPGGSLSDHRKKDASGAYLPSAAGALHFWLPTIAEALDFIHSRGVVHRDVKPANILFDGFWNAFLGDFGIAKVVGEEGGLEKGQTLTATHLAIGTPEYMAPELLSPKASADGRADQYSLAISVYEVLSGRRPFTGSAAHIVVEHATLPVPPLDRRAFGLPSSLAWAVERALAKKPEERFVSCAEFVRSALADVTPQPNEPGVVRLLCPGCRKVLRVPRDAGGGRGNCPSCRELVEISGDFSALWLKSEAAMVAESPPTPTAVPTVGLLDAVSADPAKMVALPESEFEPIGGGWGAVAAVALSLLLGVLGAAVGGGVAHSRWSAHHAAVTQQLKADRETEQASHAAALQDVASQRHEAVMALEAEWKLRIAEAERSWEEQLEFVKDAQQGSEQRVTDAERSAAAEASQRESLEVAARLREVSRPKPFSDLTNSIGITLKLIPAGSFLMGDDRNDPIHEVTLTKPFFMGVNEVTREQWQRVMGNASNSALPSKELTRSVNSVSWNDVSEFCSRLSQVPDEKREGRVYRLPTEAEWEYACRAGTTTRYSFGDDATYIGESHRAGKSQPNPWGLYDMHGGVWEWCSDRYDNYSEVAATDPAGPIKGLRRVSRGGRGSGSADRNMASPSGWSSSIGFRLVLSPPVRKEPPEAGVAMRTGRDGAKPATSTVATQTPEKAVSLAALMNSVGITLMLIPPGKFLMGDDRDGPIHEVVLTKPFYLGVTEVTNEQWLRVMRKRPSGSSGDQAGSTPMSDVTWEDADTFCKRLSELPIEKQAGRTYRLPTEAEWEYACRAGTTTAYSFGDDESLIGEYAWFSNNSDMQPHPVGQKKPSAWGLYDMHGNVWEWCGDWHGSYANTALTDTSGPSHGIDRVYRGGSWCDSPKFCRAATRGSDGSSYRDVALGFRLAMTLSGQNKSSQESTDDGNMHQSGAAIRDVPSELSDR